MESEDLLPSYNAEQHNALQNPTCFPPTEKLLPLQNHTLMNQGVPYHTVCVRVTTIFLEMSPRGRNMYM